MSSFTYQIKVRNFDMACCATGEETEGKRRENSA